MFDFPDKKIFEKDFISKKGKLLFVLRYNQATMGEFFDFQKKSHKEQEFELYQIIADCIPISIFQRILKKIIPGYKTKLEKGVDFKEIAEELQENRFRIYPSIFEEYDKKIGNKKKGGKGFFASTLQSVCSQYCTPISEVMELTLEQFFYLADGLRFSSNELTKEGKSINNYALRDEKQAKESAEKIRKAFNE